MNNIFKKEEEYHVPGPDTRDHIPPGPDTQQQIENSNEPQNSNESQNLLQNVQVYGSGFKEQELHKNPQQQSVHVHGQDSEKQMPQELQQQLKKNKNQQQDQQEKNQKQKFFDEQLKQCKQQQQEIQRQSKKNKNQQQDQQEKNQKQKFFDEQLKQYQQQQEEIQQQLKKNKNQQQLQQNQNNQGPVGIAQQQIDIFNNIKDIDEQREIILKILKQNPPCFLEIEKIDSLNLISPQSAHDALTTLYSLLIVNSQAQGKQVLFNALDEWNRRIIQIITNIDLWYIKKNHQEKNNLQEYKFSTHEEECRYIIDKQKELPETFEALDHIAFVFLTKWEFFDIANFVTQASKLIKSMQMSGKLSRVVASFCEMVFEFAIKATKDPHKDVKQTGQSMLQYLQTQQLNFFKEHGQPKENFLEEQIQQMSIAEQLELEEELRQQQQQKQNDELQEQKKQFEDSGIPVQTFYIKEFCEKKEMPSFLRVYELLQDIQLLHSQCAKDALAELFDVLIFKQKKSELDKFNRLRFKQEGDELGTLCEIVSNWRNLAKQAKEGLANWKNNNGKDSDPMAALSEILRKNQRIHSQANTQKIEAKALRINLICAILRTQWHGIDGAQKIEQILSQLACLNIEQNLLFIHTIYNKLHNMFSGFLDLEVLDLSLIQKQCLLFIGEIKQKIKKQQEGPQLQQREELQLEDQFQEDNLQQQNEESDDDVWQGHRQHRDQKHKIPNQELIHDQTDKEILQMLSFYFYIRGEDEKSALEVLKRCRNDAQFNKRITALRNPFNDNLKDLLNEILQILNDNNNSKYSFELQQQDFSIQNQKPAQLLLFAQITKRLGQHDLLKDMEQNGINEVVASIFKEENSRNHLLNLLNNNQNQDLREFILEKARLLGVGLIKKNTKKNLLMKLVKVAQGLNKWIQGDGSQQIDDQKQEQPINQPQEQQQPINQQQEQQQEQQINQPQEQELQQQIDQPKEKQNITDMLLKYLDNKAQARKKELEQIIENLQENAVFVALCDQFLISEQLNPQNSQYQQILNEVNAAAQVFNVKPFIESKKINNIN